MLRQATVGTPLKGSSLVDHNQQCTRTFFSMLRKQKHEVNCKDKQTSISKYLPIRNRLNVFRVVVLN
jgi:hypothetical protein